MVGVRFENATRVYPGSEHTSVDALSFEVRPGELMVLLGPAASGKSTALRMLAGLEEVTSGRIYINDVDVTDTPPNERDVAMVFQNYALYPHMTVADNMGFALRIAGVPAEEIDRRVRHAAAALGLEDVLDSRPQDLPGGVDRQRVAMGRAIVRQPRVFMMDDPLANLEGGTRTRTRDQIAELQHQLAITTIFATSDVEEGLAIADRVAVLDRGVLQQVDVPDRLREAPGTVFVAGYVGGVDQVVCQLPIVTDQGAPASSWGDVQLLAPKVLADQTQAVVSVPARHLRASTEPGPGVRARVTEVDAREDGVYVVTDHTLNRDAPAIAELVEAFSDTVGIVRPTTYLRARLLDSQTAAVGDEVWVDLDPQRLQWFWADTGVRVTG